jgi:hypothetical protein
VESSGDGPRLSALVGLLGSGFQLTHRKVQGQLDQLLGIEISTGAINGHPLSPQRGPVRSGVTRRRRRSCSSLLRTSMKPVARSAMPTATTPPIDAVGCRS